MTEQSLKHFMVERLVELAKENVRLENQVVQLQRELERALEEAEAWRKTANWIQGGGYK